MNAQFLFFLLLIFCLKIANAQKVSILFVGNSLTYSNDLPAMVNEIGKAHDVEVETECLCYPNYGLEDHWLDGDIPDFLKSESFDYVVFQQGPSSQEYGRISLLDYGYKISKLARTADVKPVYFMVWPSLHYYYTFDGVIENHRNAANENDALLVNVGEVWRSIHEQQGDAHLYGADGFHPSIKGTCLAAMVLYQSLVGKLKMELVPEKLKKQFSKSELQLILDSKVCLY